MALNFPNNPGIGSVFTDSTSGFSYQWNGTLWQSYSSATASNIQVLDDISGSFNGVTLTFALTSSGTAVSPVNAQQLDINLGGVIQAPGTDYTISGSNIVFTGPAPTAGLTFSGKLLGGSLPLNTVADGTVTPAKLSTGGPSWNSSGDLRVTGVVTATTFIGNHVGDVNSSGVSTFVSLRSTNINATGVTTSSGGFVGNLTGNATGLSGTPNITVGNIISGNINSSGVITATSFKGDGSGLTGAGSTVFNDATTNQSYYPTFTSITSGTITALGISTSKLTYNPSTGAVTAVDFNATSDINLKTNIKTVENALEIVDNLHGVSFEWKESGKKSYGVIAQELEEVLPELVKDGDIKSVNYNGLIGILIESIKELKKEIDDLSNNK